MTIAGKEAAKGYSSATVALALRAQYFPSVEQALLDAGGKYLSRQDVANAARDFKKANPDPRFVGANFRWYEQWEAARNWLEGEGFMVVSPIATRELDNEPSEGLLFGSSQGIEILRHRGYFALMDSTHGTNWLGWFLYTIMVRDIGGS
jgi:hypothetical protein